MIDSGQFIISQSKKIMTSKVVSKAMRLTVNEKKIYFAIVSLISPKDTEFYCYKLSVNELADLTGIHKKFLIKELHRICKENLLTLIKLTLYTVQRKD